MATILQLDQSSNDFSSIFEQFVYLTDENAPTYYLRDLNRPDYPETGINRLLLMVAILKNSGYIPADEVKSDTFYIRENQITSSLYQYYTKRKITIRNHPAFHADWMYEKSGRFSYIVR